MNNKTENKDRAIKTGMRDLNRMIVGWQLGELSIIASGSGIGKTSFMLSEVHHQNQNKNKVCLISLEMTKQQCLQKIVANETNIDSQKLMRGGRIDDGGVLTNDEVLATLTFVKDLKGSGISIYDPSHLTLKDLKDIISRESKNGCKLFFIDSLSETSTNKNLALELRSLAKVLNVSIVILCQISKQAQRISQETSGEVAPSHMDMRNSGIEEHASLIIVLHRKEMYTIKGSKQDKKVLSVNVSKNRYGKRGSVKVFFQPEFSRITNMD